MKLNDEGVTHDQFLLLLWLHVSFLKFHIMVLIQNFSM